MHLSQPRCEIQWFRRNFWLPEYQQSTGDFSPKIVFPPFLVAILNFCVKGKNAFISKWCEMERFCWNFLSLRYPQSWLGTFSKNCFPFLAAILNFCVKRKNAFILETMRDRPISSKFFTPRVSAELSGDFSQKSLSHHFWRHLEFLRKPQKRIYLGNCEIERFRQKFWHPPPPPPRVSAESTGNFPQKSIFRHFWQPSWFPL